MRQNIRIGSVTVRDGSLLSSKLVGVGWAVVVACQDVLRLCAHAVPVVGLAGFELRLSAGQACGDDAE